MRGMRWDGEVVTAAGFCWVDDTTTVQPSSLAGRLSTFLR